MTTSIADPAEQRRDVRLFYRDRRPTRLGKRVSRFEGWLAALGLAPPLLVTLQVRGRMSGRLHSNVLVATTVDGQRYLVSMLGEGSEWVKNVRAAGGEAFVKRGRSRRVRVTETPPGERAPILKAYCAVATSGRHHFPVQPDAPVSAFADIASDYPVFRIEAAQEAADRAVDGSAVASRAGDALASRPGPVNLKALVGSGDRIGLAVAPILVGGVAVNAVAPRLFKVGGPSRALRAISTAILPVGVAVWLWSVVLILTRVPKGKLITGGPYRVAKHPLYTSVALLVLPWAGFLLDTWLGVLIGTSLYAASRRYAPEEEAELAARFGPAWEAYRASVKLPWI